MQFIWDLYAIYFGNVCVGNVYVGNVYVGNVYVGKTVTSLSLILQNVNGHKSSYLTSSSQDKKFNLRKPDSIDDENVLGAHLLQFMEK